MATTDARIDSTTSTLSGFVNEALLELGNTRRSAFQLSGSDVTIPDSPVTDVTTTAAPTKPNIESPDPISNVQMPRASGAAKFPNAPSEAKTTTWSGPSRPRASSKHLEFFTGTPETPEEVIDRANEAVEAWAETHFPALKDCFTKDPEDSESQDVPDQWICDVVAGVRPLGNSEEAIYIAWRAAKANEFQQLTSERRTISEEFSKRGFSLPPGAMLAQTRRSQERFSDAVAAVNREAALKDIDVQVQLLQLAVQVGADLKRGLLTIMADFYNKMTELNRDTLKDENERARLVADVEQRFTDSLLNYENINQQYYASLNQYKLEGARTNLSRYDSQSQNAARAADFTLRNAQLNLEAAQAELTAAIERSKAQSDIAQTQASVYNVETNAWAAKVSADVSVAQFKVEKYKAEVAAAIGKATANTGAGTGLAGAARGFGAIGQAAAQASGTLVAQVEGL